MYVILSNNSDIRAILLWPISRPYDGKWSKTMIGYGPEDNHFVCELTYNYGISTYEMGQYRTLWI